MYASIFKFSLLIFVLEWTWTNIYMDLYICILM
jgi:hypothetical protein